MYFDHSFSIKILSEEVYSLNKAYQRAKPGPERRVAQINKVIKPSENSALMSKTKKKNMNCWLEHNYFKLKPIPQSVTVLCTFCGLQFDSKKAQREHENNQHIKPFQCNQCGRAFGSKAMCKRHMELHSQIEMR